jgi:hypothetical protein
MRVMRRPSSFDSVSSVLTGLARRLGLDAKLLEQRLRRRWPEVVGEHIGTHTRPEQIRFKKLYVTVESSVWLQQLMFLKPALVDKINAEAAREVVTDLVFRVGDIARDAPEGEGQPGAGKGDDAAIPTPELLEEAAAHAAAVSDSDLRNRLASVMARMLAAQTQRSDRPVQTQDRRSAP